MDSIESNQKSIKDFNLLSKKYKKSLLKLLFIIIYFFSFLVLTILLIYGAILIYRYNLNTQRFYTTHISGISIALIFIATFMIFLGLISFVHSLWLLIRNILKFKIIKNRIKVYQNNDENNSVNLLSKIFKL